jgi:hypothetical protein
MELFSQSGNPYKEITESMAVYKNVKEFIDVQDPKETYVMIGDGSLALTAALFAFLTKGQVISIDPRLNTTKVAEWRRRENVRRFIAYNVKFQDLLYYRNYIPPKPYHLICVHAHVNLEELNECFPYWKYIYSNPCCNPHEQTFSVQYQKKHNIGIVKAGYDTENLSPKNMVFIYENKNIEKPNKDYPMGEFRDCNDCGCQPGDCLSCSDVTKNMFTPKKEPVENESREEEHEGYDSWAWSELCDTD